VDGFALHNFSTLIHFLNCLGYVEQSLPHPLLTTKQTLKSKPNQKPTRKPAAQPKLCTQKPTTTTKMKKKR
jgi:hypothetical protein